MIDRAVFCVTLTERLLVYLSVAFKSFFSSFVVDEASEFDVDFVVHDVEGLRIETKFGVVFASMSQVTKQDEVADLHFYDVWFVVYG